MVRKTVKAGDKNAAQLSNEILGLYDEFAEFHEQCAFLCDAFSAIAHHRQLEMDIYCANGLELHANWLKRRVAELKARLQSIHEMSWHRDCRTRDTA